METNEDQPAVIWKIEGGISNWGATAGYITFVLTLRSIAVPWTYRKIAITDWVIGTTRGEVAEFAVENVEELWEEAK